MEFFVVLVFVVVVAFAASRIFGVKRTRDLRKLAERSGFEFEERTRRPGVGSFALFHRGHRNEYRNLLKKQKDGVSWKVFDFVRRSVPGNRGGHRRPLTVARAKVGNRSFPVFCMKPEGITAMLEHLVGMKDLDLESYPEFSRKYALRGEDEEAIRAMFTPALVQFLEHGEFGGVLEGHGNTLIYYRSGRRIPAREMLSFIEESEAIVSAFV